MSPLSRDPAKRARQLQNLKRAPPAPLGHLRNLRHGGRVGPDSALYRDVDSEVAELRDALGEAAPVRELDGSLPDADLVAVEQAARALKRWRHVSSWCDLHGRVTEDGEVKPAAQYELQAERQLGACLDALGMNPTARARLGVDLVRAAATVETAEANREARERLDQRLGDLEQDGDD